MLTDRVQGKTLYDESDSTLGRQKEVTVQQRRVQRKIIGIGRCELGNCGNGVSVDADYAITMICDVITPLLSDMQSVYRLSLRRERLAQAPDTRGWAL